MNDSRIPITRSFFKGISSRLLGVRVNRSSKQVTGNNEMGWLRSSSIIHTSLRGQQKIQWYLKEQLSNKDWSFTGLNKVSRLAEKTNHIHGCFEINSMFRTAVHFFLKTWFWVIQDQMIWNNLKEDTNYFE